MPDLVYLNAHIVWRAQLARAAAGVVGLAPGTQARRLLVGGRWQDGQWVYTAVADTGGYWVDAWTRGVIPHSQVQGWQLNGDVPAMAARFDPMVSVYGFEPASDGTAEDPTPAEEDAHATGMEAGFREAIRALGDISGHAMDIEDFEFFAGKIRERAKVWHIEITD